MSAHRADLPFIPLGGWRTRAACAERATERLWDDRLDYELDGQRNERHEQAKAVCRRCPVRTECSDAVDWKVDEGIRGGHKLPTLGVQHTAEEDALIQRLKSGWPLDQAVATGR